MTRKAKSFDDRFLSKIGKIDRSHIREYLAQTLSQKQFLETLFDHLDEGIIVTDSGLRIIHSNGVARRMLQWPANKRFLGEPLAQRCPEGDLRFVLEQLTARPRALDGREFPFGPGGDRRLVLKAIPMDAPAEDDGEPSAPLWVFLLQDATERYRTLEEQARAQRLASLALLTAGIAHEIKNPLNSLNIHAEILLKQGQSAEGRDSLDPAKVARAASVILEETQRLTEIVNVFIQAARPQGPILEKNSVNRVCEDIIRVLGPECEQAGVLLKADLDPDLPLILLDIHLMFQALRNLVRNALEAHEEALAAAVASPPPKDLPAIILRTRLSPGAVTIDVVDNGPGIPEDKLERIFEPYFSTKFDGTGLGLMVVYRVVTEHQGVIHVDSRPGVGTRFKITLPLTERPVRLLEEPRAETATGVV